MVTWGPTTVLGKNGSTATATATPSLFGSTLGGTATATTATTPATNPTQPTTPSSANFFSSSSASSPSLFNFSSNPIQSPQSSVPSPSVSTATSSSLFSSTAGTSTGFFGTSGLFGTTNNTNNTAASNNSSNNAGLEAAQQAAIQAHMNATQHQEASRLESKLLQLYNAYSPYTAPAQPTPAAPAPSSFFTPAPPPPPPPPAQLTPNPNCQFQFVFYDDMTPSQRLDKTALSSSTGTTIDYPPKPSHISTDQWTHALAQNPNPDQYVPVLLTSAEGLHSRLVKQQSQASHHNSYITTLDETIRALSNAILATQTKIKALSQRNVLVRQRLLQLLRKLEICRGKGMVLQPSERMAFHKVQEVWNTITRLGQFMESLKVDGETYVRHLQLVQQQQRMLGVGGGGNAVSSLSSSSNTNPATDVSGNFLKEIHVILKQQRDGMDELNEVLKKDERDLQIVKQGTLDVLGPGSSGGSGGVASVVGPIGVGGGPRFR